MGARPERGKRSPVEAGLWRMLYRSLIERTNGAGLGSGRALCACIASARLALPCPLPDWPWQKDKIGYVHTGGIQWQTAQQAQINQPELFC